MKKFSRKIAAAAALAITVSSCMTGCFNNTGSVQAQVLQEEIQRQFSE